MIHELSFLHFSFVLINMWVFSIFVNNYQVIIFQKNILIKILQSKKIKNKKVQL